MGCGCGKKKTTRKPVPKSKSKTTPKNRTHEQQEKLVNEIIEKINRATRN